MAISYPNAISERQKGVAGVASEVTQSTQLATLRATRSLTQTVWRQAVFAMTSPILLATAFTSELVDQQLSLAKQLTELFVKPPSKVTTVAPKPRRVTTADDNAQAFVAAADAAEHAFVTAADDAAQASVTNADNAAKTLVSTAQALAKTADEALQARMNTADAVVPARIKTTEEDQEILLRAERLVINKQNVKQGEARVRKEIVTDMQTIQVPVSHEELVIERFAVSGDVDVDSAPIAAETIRIPLTEEKVDISKKTFVRELVEIGKLRVEGIEHISDTVRHEELRVDDTTTPATPWVNPDNYAKTPDNAASAPITPAQALAMTPDGVAPKLVTPAQAVATMPDDAATEAVTTSEDDQEIDLRAERLVINKQRAQTGKARVRKEIVTETKSIAVPVSHEELVINRQAVSGDVDVDVASAPIADETIRIPLSEDEVNVGKETVVREEVEIGKRRVEGMEHISDTLRHEELRVNDTTNHKYESTS